MEDGLQIVGVPLITALVFGAMLMYRIVFADNEKASRLVPVWAILLGCVFGIIAYFFAGEVMPAGNVLTALLVGGASGLAATGTHQIYRQLTKDSLISKEPDDKSDIKPDESVLDDDVK